VAIGRELTKAHEELVRGPISLIIGGLQAPRGEFTVVVDIGHITDSRPNAQPDDSALVTEFGHLTYNNAMDRKHAIATLTQKYGRTRNDIYAVIERAKKSIV
jgi:16S rRNA C1402 (ribose-2'-O) methylase RsmI